MTAPIPIGQHLIERGHVTPELLAEALRRQSDLPGVRVGRILVDLGVPEQIILEALAIQAGLPWMRLADRIVPSDLALRVPAEYARRYRTIPVELKDGHLMMAVSDPTDFSHIEMVGRIFDQPVKPVLVSDSDMEIALDRVYGRTFDKAERRHQDRRKGDRGIEARRDTGADDQNDAAAVRVLDILLLRAVRDGASDIHIEPFERLLRIRLRIDGILHEVAVENVPPRSLVARCKILSSLDPAEMRRPQDGHFRREIEGRNLDIRVSTIPAIFGEKIVLRLQDRTRDLLRIDALGMDEDVRETFRAAIKRPHGLILVTGPTGSGKTTTLYAALSERNHQGLNLTTIEDPVEFDLFGVNQIQINPKIDVTFAKGLRHILRQDPDIILVGEIRDKETADVAIQAAMTGHLVLSTLHTNDSIGAIARLVDMGVPAFLIADSLLAVLSQRLVRRLCPLCRKESTLTPEEAAMLNAEATEKIYRAGACSSCLGTGYRGRMGLYEFLSIAPPIAGLIRVRSSSDELIQSARQSGFRTLREDGRTKIREGLTTVDEVERVS